MLRTRFGERGVRLFLRNVDIAIIASARTVEIEAVVLLLHQLRQDMKIMRMDTLEMEHTAVADSVPGISQAIAASPLTERELEIIALSLCPMTKAEIAARLALGETEISHHFTSIRHKLGISDRLDLIVYAYCHDLEIDEPRRKCKALADLGHIYLLAGKTDSAIECFEEQLKMTRAINDRTGEGEALCNLGRTFLTWGAILRAVNSYEQCLSIARQQSNRRREGDALSGLALAYLPLGYTRYAIKHSERALSIFRLTADPGGEGRAIFDLSLAMDKLGNRLQAIAFAEEAARILKKSGSAELAAVHEQLTKWRDKNTHSTTRRSSDLHIASPPSTWMTCPVM